MNITNEQGLVFLSDEMYLPLHYREFIAKEPHYEGEGNHTVSELERICRQFKEYVHQQSIIKHNCMKEIVELKYPNGSNSN